MDKISDTTGKRKEVRQLPKAKQIGLALGFLLPTIDGTVKYFSGKDLNSHLKTVIAAQPFKPEGTYKVEISRSNKNRIATVTETDTKGTHAPKSEPNTTIHVQTNAPKHGIHLDLRITKQPQKRIEGWKKNLWDAPQ